MCYFFLWLAKLWAITFQLKDHYELRGAQLEMLPFEVVGAMFVNTFKGLFVERGEATFN